jgi:stage V sporulation protein G
MSDTKFSVRVFPSEEPKGNVKAFASVTFEDFVVVRDLRVVEGKNGLFVAMPQAKGTDGKYRDLAFPTTGELRADVSRAILDRYKDLMKDGTREAPLSEAPSGTVDKLSHEFTVWIRLVNEPKTKTMAFASLSFKDMMAIQSLRVVDGKNGLFVTMPQAKGADGKYYDVAFPATGELRKDITKSVLEAYKDAVREKAAEKEIAEKEKPQEKGLGDKLAAAEKKLAEQRENSGASVREPKDRAL